jgi:hypothetical protein
MFPAWCRPDRVPPVLVALCWAEVVAGGSKCYPHGCPRVMAVDTRTGVVTGRMSADVSDVPVSGLSG